jgi:hypothetical protein
MKQTNLELFGTKELWSIGCLFFIGYAILFSALTPQAFADNDPLWHVAAGDWIRRHNALPLKDPWSFTAGDYRWLNISWLWDITFSKIVEESGWYGAVVINNMLIATTYALIAALCLKHGASVFATLVTTYAIFTLQSVGMRPLHTSNLMLAIDLWLLMGCYRGWIKTRLLWALPVMTALWSNIHGGVIINIALPLFYILQAQLDKNAPLFKQLCWVWAGCVVGIFCNPYGFNIIETIYRPLTDPANNFVLEWRHIQPNISDLVTFSYLAIFLVLSCFHRPPFLKAEWLLITVWFLLSIYTVRYSPLFTLISAPIFARQLHWVLTRGRKSPSEQAKKIDAAITYFLNQRSTALILLAISIATIVTLPTSYMAHINGNPQLPPYTAKPEVLFIQKHYPHIRFLNDFDIGGLLLYDSQGTLPVFIDSRNTTSYPSQVIQDYITINKAKPGWEKLLDHYAINGAIIYHHNNTPSNLYKNLTSLGWKNVYREQSISILISPQQLKAGNY